MILQPLLAPPRPPLIFPHPHPPQPITFLASPPATLWPPLPALPSFPLASQLPCHPLLPFRPLLPFCFATALTSLRSLSSTDVWCICIAMQAAAAAAAEAAVRRGAEAAARQAHRQELRQREEAQALLNLRAFKDSIKAAVSRVSPSAPAPCNNPPSPFPPLLPASHPALSCDRHVCLSPETTSPNKLCGLQSVTTCVQQLAESRCRLCKCCLHFVLPPGLPCCL